MNTTNDTFQLDPRLDADCIYLMTFKEIQILLMDNVFFPWFILVPQTHVTEVHQLSEPEFFSLMTLQKKIASFVSSHFEVDKLNIAAIGNVVSQLHFHVVGRRHDDHCWPAPVWGNCKKESYSPETVNRIKRELTSVLEISEY